jgi:CRISPR-associated protein Csd2
MKKTVAVVGPVVEHRYEFVLLWDCVDGNANGNPDMDDMPRMDLETRQGLVSDVCVKRKVRNYILEKFQDKSPYQIYYKQNAILNDIHKIAHGKVKKVNPALAVQEAQKYLCQNYWDIRTFGGVMNTGMSCGNVTGPVEIGFSRSIDPIFIQNHTITRCSATKKKESKKLEKGRLDEERNQTMGRKHTVPYALFRTEGYVVVSNAVKSGMSNKDLEILWDALVNMFEIDRSSRKGKMTAHKLIIFKHNSSLGNARASELFDLIDVKSTKKTPRAFSDYKVSIKKLPASIKGVSVTEYL